MKVHTYTCGYEIISSKHLVGQCVINRRHNKTVQARRRERERQREREREREREMCIQLIDLVEIWGHSNAWSRIPVYL